MTRLLSRKVLPPQPSRVDWPKDEDKITLLKAVEKKQYETTFKDGRVFKISYRTSAFSLASTNEDRLYVYVSQKGEFGPCGWFDVSKLRGEVAQWI